MRLVTVTFNVVNMWTGCNTRPYHGHVDVNRATTSTPYPISSIFNILELIPRNFVPVNIQWLEQIIDLVSLPCHILLSILQLNLTFELNMFSFFFKCECVVKGRNRTTAIPSSNLRFFLTMYKAIKIIHANRECVSNIGFKILIGSYEWSGEGTLAVDCCRFIF